MIIIKRELFDDLAKNFIIYVKCVKK